MTCGWMASQQRYHSLMKTKPLHLIVAMFAAVFVTGCASSDGNSDFSTAYERDEYRQASRSAERSNPNTGVLGARDAVHLIEAAATR